MQSRGQSGGSTGTGLGVLDAEIFYSNDAVDLLKTNC